MWGELWYFDVGTDGTVAALDRFHHRVRVFSPDGSAIDFGGEGDGPGELRTGGPLVVMQDRIVMVDRGRIQSWSFSGEWIDSKPSPPAHDLLEWGEGQLGAQVGVWDGGPIMVDGRRNTAIQVSGLDSFSFGEPSFSSVGVELGEGRGICYGCSFTPTLRGAYAVTNHPRGAVVRFDEAGRAGGAIYLDRDPEDWPEERWARHLRRGRAALHFSGATRAPYDPNRPVIPPRAPMPVIAPAQSIGVTSDGILLINVNRDAPGTTLAAFGPDDVYLGDLVIDGTTLEHISIEGRWLVGVSFDQWDQPELYRARLPRLSGLR